MLNAASAKSHFFKNFPQQNQRLNRGSLCDAEALPAPFFRGGAADILDHGEVHNGTP
jgi:hypothetical protein